MNNPVKHIIQFRNRWKTQLFMVIGIYALGGGACTYLLTKNSILTAVVFVWLSILLYIFKKPQRITIDKTSNYLNDNLQEIEHSSDLFIKDFKELSRLEQIQYYDKQEVISKKLPKLVPPVSFTIPIILTTLLLLIGFIGHTYFIPGIVPSQGSMLEENKLVFTTTDSLLHVEKPKIVDKFVVLKYPAYTGMTMDTLTSLNIKAIEGTIAEWNLKLDYQPDSLLFTTTHSKTNTIMSNEYSVHQEKLSYSHFYSFTFVKDTVHFTSDLYPVQVSLDKKPSITINGLDQFSTIRLKDAMNLQFTTILQDDFGLNRAHIVATVSQGSGESVKFREEKLNFNTTPRPGSKRQKLFKNLNLKQLGMEPGDELYFYVEATDQKYPNPNTTRSETYFAKIEDTLTSTFAVEGAMAVDIMPAYFRSQRQLIIDTERLIKEKSNLLESTFNNRSNNLGYEQKTLRIKYGQFMGDETEMETESGDIHNLDSHKNESSLDPYIHKHDTQNEHNLDEDQHDHQHKHEHDHQENEKEGTSKIQDPLASYIHNHDDPEESTLFTASLKSKLRKALSYMWDAELQLRLYQPKKSLPYQYKALKLLQNIKNSARIYVHRIGFDPPPIKETSRLSGDLTKIKRGKIKETHTDEPLYPNLQKVVSQISTYNTGKELIISRENRNLFESAGMELAEIAINQPGQYLESLQTLKKIIEAQKVTTVALNKLKKSLYTALPAKTKKIHPDQFRMTPLDFNYLNSLQQK